MSNYKHIKEFLGTGSAEEGSLLIPKKIYDTLIEEVDKRLIQRSEAAIYIGPAGIPNSSIELNFVTPDSLSLRDIGEFGEFPMDSNNYASRNVKPLKYGVALRISKEMEEDGKWDLFAQQIKTIGKRFSEKENSLIITELDNASNTVSGSDQLTVANITRAMQYLDDKDYDPTTFVVGMEVLKDIRDLDTFVEAQKKGDDEVLKTGFIGVIYGMKVFKVSSNAGMTSANAYVFDRDHAYAIVEKRPVTMEDFKLPLFDSRGATFSQRIKVRYLRADAIVKITT
jgi:HK97 family phage major capsid protein